MPQRNRTEIVANSNARPTLRAGLAQDRPLWGLGDQAYRLASELSDRIAAVAPVAGTLGVRPIRATRPVSVLHFHGSADESLPFRGGHGKGLSSTDFYPVEQAIDDWVQANGCQEPPAVKMLPDKTNDGTKILRKSYGAGKGRRGGIDRDRRWRAHLAWTRGPGKGSGQEHQEHLRQ